MNRCTGRNVKNTYTASINYFTNHLFQMKTLLFRSKTVLIWAALLWYIAWLFVQWKTVAGTASLQLSSLIVCALIALYLIAIIAIKWLMPTNRYTIACIGVAAILYANLYMIDDPSTHVYLADIMKLVWVFLAIAWPMKLLSTKEMEQAQFDKSVEIIEV